METGLGLQHLGSQDSTPKYPECRPGLLQTTKAGGRGTGTYPGPVYLLLAQGQDQRPWEETFRLTQRDKGYNLLPVSNKTGSKYPDGAHFGFCREFHVQRLFIQQVFTEGLECPVVR